MKIRDEYPNPQFVRENWLNLNGQWDFGYRKADGDFEFSKDESKALSIFRQGIYTDKINVPFCPQSELSGIADTDFINLAYYRKIVNLQKTDSLIYLHIGAADYLTTILVNGKPAGRHKGGYSSFEFEISEYIIDGDNEIFILCEDNEKDLLVPSGKQSMEPKSHACEYTRTTGIWQTVYLEYVPKTHIETFYFYPDAKSSSIKISAALVGNSDFECEIYYENHKVGKFSKADLSGETDFNISLTEKHLWQPGNGRLYDVVMRFGEDTVRTYFGLRDIALDGYKFLLNGKSVFQRLVLDQGFYPKGIYTSESTDDMINDIEISIALGFNGARLHQKVFEPLFLYYCDKMGYMVWGEYANWGLDYSNESAVDIYLEQWGEAIKRDFNHPSIIGWCPFNETWEYESDRIVLALYEYTKKVDSTRPCIDTSGNFHVKTDIYDIHDYNGDVDFFKKNFDRFMTDNELYEHVLIDHPGRQKYTGGPVFVSEYGGIRWVSDKSIESWGYGEDVKTEDEFADRYEGLTNALLQNYKMMGFCYTQLYDVEQEQNGLYTYERKKKFSDDIYEKIRKINSQKAAIE